MILLYPWSLTGPYHQNFHWCFSYKGFRGFPEFGIFEQHAKGPILAVTLFTKSISKNVFSCNSPTSFGPGLSVAPMLLSILMYCLFKYLLAFLLGPLNKETQVSFLWIIPWAFNIGLFPPTSTWDVLISGRRGKGNPRNFDPPVPPISDG